MCIYIYIYIYIYKLINEITESSGVVEQNDRFSASSILDKQSVSEASPLDL